MAEKTEYVLTDAESAVLLAATEDAVGARGPRGLGVRMTKPQTAETSVDVEGAADAVRLAARGAITEHGSVITDPNATDDGSVWGLVASGIGNMVPALVRVEVQATGEHESHVCVRATGREGLIKQKIGARVADRIAHADMR